jgi:predicted transglutaminase-like cysteine proteinase
MKFLAATALVAFSFTQAGAGNIRHQPIGDQVNPPIGWIGFCAATPADCAGGTRAPMDIVMTPKVWETLQAVNSWANESVKPVTDQEHWGTIEKWSIPTDGYGDCEDYVLLKRKTLIDAGWPREALLVTVVRDRNDEGHAVLTVKTDKGDFILDNENEKIVMWNETGYRYVKRQSQIDQNTWVSVGAPAPGVATAGTRKD